MPLMGKFIKAVDDRDPNRPARDRTTSGDVMEGYSSDVVDKSLGEAGWADANANFLVGSAEVGE